MINASQSAFAYYGNLYADCQHHFAGWAGWVNNYCTSGKVKSLRCVAVDETDIDLIFLGRRIIIRLSIEKDSQDMPLGRLTAYHLDGLPLRDKATVIGAFFMDPVGNVGDGPTKIMSVMGEADRERVLLALLQNFPGTTKP